jgi:glycosyltransferase involved in cell wall biosynthesis
MRESISIIIPLYNEAKALPILHERLVALYDQFKKVEVIFVNDCSKDESLSVLREIARTDPHVRVISFARNYGQTAAIRAGIEHAEGDIVVPIDSDLENDPHDIPELVTKLEEGYDVVSGWRKGRWSEQRFSRKLPSMIANRLISYITGVHLHDFGCTMKAYRRESLSDVPLYGEMHRFIAAYAARRGGKVAEIPVRYEPRRFGKSHYGISRTFRVLLDLLVIRFLDRYMDRPIHFFGGVGFIFFFFGMLSGSAAVVLRLFFDLHFVQTPLPVLTTMFFIVSLNLVLMGILSEMMMRTYYESSGRKPYRIKESINIE